MHTADERSRSAAQLPVPERVAEPETEVPLLGAGNGQAAAALAKRYRTVHAQDASAEQVRRCPGPGSFRVCRSAQMMAFAATPVRFTTGHAGRGSGRCGADDRRRALRGRAIGGQRSPGRQRRPADRRAGHALVAPPHLTATAARRCSLTRLDMYVFCPHVKRCHPGSGGRLLPASNPVFEQLTGSLLRRSLARPMSRALALHSL